MGIDIRNRKIVIGAGIAAALLIMALLALLVASNRIIKGRIEQSLGGNSTVERVALGWNRVEVVGLRLFPNSPTTISAERIDIRASFFTVFSKRYDLSRLTIHRPSVRLHFDRKGNLDNPFSSGSKGLGEPSSSRVAPPLDVRKATILDGSLTITDDRKAPGDTIELTKIELQADNLSLPDGKRPSRFSLRALIGGKTLSGMVSCSGKINIGTQSGEMTLEVTNIQGAADARGPRLKAESLKCNVSSEAPGPRGRTISLSDVRLVNPFIRLEEDRKGNLITPFSSSGGEEPKKSRKEETRVALQKLRVTGGEILYLDGSVANPPYPVTISNIAASFDVLSIPFQNRLTAWQLSANIPGKRATGSLQGSGSIDLFNYDTRGKLALRSLDLVTLRPYIVKKGQADVVAGTLDMDVDMSVKNRAIYAPTHAVIRNLQLASGQGKSDLFLGIPRDLIIKLLETSKNELPLDFILQGNLDNLKFSLQESFVRRLAVSIGRKLGISVIGTGEDVIIQGSKVLKGVGRSIGGLFK